MKLNQVIAVIKGLKQKANKAKTSAYQSVQKPQLFQGLNRTYQPRDEEGYVYPSEALKVTMQATDLIESFRAAASELFNMAATQDWANTEAKASVKVNDKVIVADVPVTHLMFLEKQLVDIHTFIEALPVLPIDKEWEYDSNRGLYATEVKQSAKTKKVTEFVVAYEATKEHPAQIKEVSKDVVEGTWSLVELSSALPQDEVNQYMQNVDKLLEAVIKAREEANNLEVTKQEIANPIFDFIFQKV